MRALGGHERRLAPRALHRAPVEGAAGDQVDEATRSTATAKTRISTSPNAPRLAVDHRVRVEEDDLDVEDDEDHRHQVEAAPGSARAARGWARCRTRTAPPWRRVGRRGASNLDIHEADRREHDGEHQSSRRSGRYWPIASTSGRGGYRRRAVLGDRTVSPVQHGAQDREDRAEAQEHQRGRARGAGRCPARAPPRSPGRRGRPSGGGGGWPATVSCLIDGWTWTMA